MRKFVRLLPLLSGVAFGAGPDFSQVNLDLGPIYALAGIVVGGGIGMFVVRKAIKLMNRS
ncbi:MAG: hypothetical protein DSY42_00700 [Aquifex sp.]|nr:MAG: hypothetical protein DSY42_00700 [Aquifex sp.]